MSAVQFRPRPPFNSGACEKSQALYFLRIRPESGRSGVCPWHDAACSAEGLLSVMDASRWARRDASSGRLTALSQECPKFARLPQSGATTQLSSRPTTPTSPESQARQLAALPSQRARSLSHVEAMPGLFRFTGQSHRDPQKRQFLTALPSAMVHPLMPTTKLLTTLSFATPFALKHDNPILLALFGVPTTWFPLTVM